MINNIYYLLFIIIPITIVMKGHFITNVTIISVA